MNIEVSADSILVHSRLDNNKKVCRRFCRFLKENAEENNVCKEGNVRYLIILDLVFCSQVTLLFLHVPFQKTILSFVSYFACFMLDWSTQISFLFPEMDLLLCMLSVKRGVKKWYITVSLVKNQILCLFRVFSAVKSNEQPWRTERKEKSRAFFFISRFRGNEGKFHGEKNDRTDWRLNSSCAL